MARQFSDYESVCTQFTRSRLEGLDVARYIALFGMVIVHFKIVMGAEGGNGLASLITSNLEGRAAATFVVLAGVGLGLASLRGIDQTIKVTVKRAMFLWVLGLLNTLMFEADILHYYAVYLLLGCLFLRLSTRTLMAAIILLNASFVIMIFVFNYEAGWNWDEYSYAGFWTLQGFFRNLFFNGWHPVVPWFGFILFGIILSRMTLTQKRTQDRLIVFGALAIMFAEALVMLFLPILSAVDAAFTDLVTTKPIPPMPLYTMAGMGCASVVIGLCLRLMKVFQKLGIIYLVTSAGRQTLTLYIAHIIIGMGVLEALGMLGGQTVEVSLLASLIFTLTATIYALFWARIFKRGPVEALMRKLAG